MKLILSVELAVCASVHFIDDPPLLFLFLIRTSILFLQMEVVSPLELCLKHVKHVKVLVW